MTTKMMKLVKIVLMTFLYTSVHAQNVMRIHYKDGEHTDIPITAVDSLTFVDGEEDNDDDATLIGSWLWDDMDAGYYEVLDFKDDKSYIGYDNYFTYGFDTMTYGWYVHNHGLLMLQSNGFGYNRRNTWYVMTLTKNALVVMTKMGSFTYYKLQSELIHLSVGQELDCEPDNSWHFADGVAIAIVDNKLLAQSIGTTYVQKFIGETKEILSYIVVVE